MSRRLTFWLLVLIVLVGIALRAWQLTARSLWFDEAFTWRLLQFSVPDLVRSTAADSSPPLYYLLLQGWTWVFGSSVLALRSFSVACSALSILLAYAFAAKASSSRRAGLIAATFLALSPWQITAASDARMYSLGVFLALLSSWLFLKAVQHSTLITWGVYAVSAAALIYTQYFGFFTLLAHAGAIAFIIVRRTRGRLVEVLEQRLSWYAGWAFLCIALLFGPWVPILIHQMKQIRAAFWVASLTAWSVPDTFARFLFHPELPLLHAWPLAILTVFPLVLTVLGALFLLWLSRGTSRVSAILVVLATILPPLLTAAISLAGRSIYEDRYLIFAQTFFLIGLALLIDYIPRVAWYRLTALLIICTLLAGYVVLHNSLDISQKEGARAAAARLTAEAGSEPVIVTSPYIFLPIDYHLEERSSEISPLLLNPNVEIVHFAGAAALTPEEIVLPDILAATPAQSLWLVDTTGYGSTETQSLPGWRRVTRQAYPEVLPFQGEVIVSRWQR